MNTIPTDQVSWLNEKLGDDFGRVFTWEGKVYRAIYHGAVERVRRLFDTGVIRELVERGWFVPTEITGLSLEGFGLVLAHQKVPFYTSGFEWPPSLRRDAALCWVEINLVLLRHRLALSDAHPFNIGQIDACRPVWLDLGSLRPPQETAQGIEQFRQYFLNPLRLAARTHRLRRLSRAVIRTGGLSNQEMESLSGTLLPTHFEPMQKVIRRVEQFVAKRKGSGGANTPAAEVDFQRREEILLGLKAELQALRFTTEHSYWGGYQERQKLAHQQLDEEPPDRRTAAILQAIEAFSPKRVIDLASNAGFFSFFAARRGAEVLAMDIDEPSVEKLYLYTRENNPPCQVVCAVRDITEPLGGDRAIRVERKADLVLALAITHHLCMVEGYTFEFVARLLASYSTDAVLVEFMPHGRGVEAPKPDPLPEWYTKEKFLDAMRQHFTTAEVIADNHERAWRILILCRGVRS